MPHSRPESLRLLERRLRREWHAGPPPLHRQVAHLRGTIPQDLADALDLILHHQSRRGGGWLVDRHCRQALALLDKALLDGTRPTKEAQQTARRAPLRGGRRRRFRRWALSWLWTLFVLFAAVALVFSVP